MSRYQLRQRLISVGDDYWIDDEAGERAFRVNGKALRIRKMFVLATVKKALVGFRDRFSIDVDDDAPDLLAKGNIVDHEYEIERDGDTVATVSKRWFAVRDTYGVEIAPGEGPRDHRVHRSDVAPEELTVNDRLRKATRPSEEAT